MFGTLRQNFSPATLAQLAVELLWLFATGVAVLHIATQLSNQAAAIIVPALVFALLILSLNGAFGIYRRGEKVTSSGYLLRLLLAPAIGVPLAYVAANVLPGGREFQEHLGTVVLFGIGGLLLVRHGVVLPIVTTMLPHRVLVLGTGPGGAARGSLARGSASAGTPALRLLSRSTRCASPACRRPRSSSPARRCRMPCATCVSTRSSWRCASSAVASCHCVRLLDCRLAGVEITDLARFFERVHGKVPIELLKVSWLIYGNGYRQGWARTLVKRDVRRPRRNVSCCS